MARQKLLKEKYQIKEEGQWLRKRKERFEVEKGNCSSYGPLVVLRLHTSQSGKESIPKCSEKINSYIETFTQGVKYMFSLIMPNHLSCKW